MYFRSPSIVDGVIMDTSKGLLMRFSSILTVVIRSN